METSGAHSCRTMAPVQTGAKRGGATVRDVERIDGRRDESRTTTDGSETQQGRNHRGGPALRVHVRFDDMREIDQQRVRLLADGQSVHIARRAARHERPVRLVLRVMFRALEAHVPGQPLQCGVLVRAGQVERVQISSVTMMTCSLRSIVTPSVAGSGKRRSAPAGMPSANDSGSALTSPLFRPSAAAVNEKQVICRKLPRADDR